MTDDLHQRVTARIAELRAVAEAAQEALKLDDQWAAAPAALWHHLVAWQPAWVLPWLDWAQEVADRHAPQRWSSSIGMVECSHCRDSQTGFLTFPCEDYRDLAKALGIEGGG